MLYTLFLVWMASKGCDFPLRLKQESTKQPGVLFLFTVLFFEPSAGGLNSLVVPVLAGLRRRLSLAAEFASEQQLLPRMPFIG